MTDANRIRLKIPPYAHFSTYILSPYGRKYSEEDLLISREERASSGMLRRDIIATKKVFNLSYLSIMYEDLQFFKRMFSTLTGAVLKLEINKPNMLSSLPGAVVTEEYDVLMSGFSSGRLTVGQQGIWENVSLTFTEI